MYQTFVDELIVKSFPELKGKVFVREKKMKSKALARHRIYGRVIFISRSLRKYSLRSLKGMFVHELCHFELYGLGRSSWFNAKLSLLKQIFFEKYRKSEETAADRLVIKKGYAQDLLLTRKKLKPRNARYYLDIREIKAGK
jgi:hypothetical protein